MITGTIKNNFPTRIAFQVTSDIDSRTILDTKGATQLLGMGDMLHMDRGGQPDRVAEPEPEEVDRLRRRLDPAQKRVDHGGVGDRTHVVLAVTAIGEVVLLTNRPGEEVLEACRAMGQRIGEKIQA